MDVPALRTAETGAHDVGAHQDLLVTEPVRHRGQVGLGVGNAHVLRLAAIDRVPQLPAPHGLATALTGDAFLARVALPAGGNGPRDYTLAHRVAGHRAPQLFDHPDGFVPDDAPGLHGILALEDMNIGPADRGGRHPQQGIRRPDLRDGPILNLDPTRLDENRRLHRTHAGLLGFGRLLHMASCATCLSNIAGRPPGHLDRALRSRPDDRLPYNKATSAVQDRM